MTSDVVICTDLPAVSHGGERLLQIARWLTRRGVRVEIIALGEGTRPDLERFRTVAPTTVVDRFRRQGPARLPHLLGARRLATGIKQVRLRRWLGRRRRATFLIHDPVAAALVRHCPHRPARVIAAFPDASWSAERMRAEDLSTFVEADAWITCDDEQTRSVTVRFRGPVVELGAAVTAGALLDPIDFPQVTGPLAGVGAAVLLSPLGLWESVDHAIEIAWQLHRAVPEMPIRWVVGGEQDRWLARHDLAHAGLTHAVELVTDDAPEVLEDVAVVVRTGYEPSHGVLALAAALHGTPVLGFCTNDLPPSAPTTPPLDVEQLVQDVVGLATDDSLRSRLGEELRNSVTHLDVEHHITVLQRLLLPEDSAALGERPISRG